MLTGTIIIDPIFTYGRGGKSRVDYLRTYRQDHKVKVWQNKIRECAKESELRKLITEAFGRKCIHPKDFSIGNCKWSLDKTMELMSPELYRELRQKLWKAKYNTKTGAPNEATEEQSMSCMSSVTNLEGVEALQVWR